MTFDEIILDVKEKIATITLNRPEKLNAYTAKMGQELLSALDTVINDDGINVLVVTGAGRAFSAGVDINRGRAPEEGIRGKVFHDNIMAPVIRKLREVYKPVIAAINGVIAGGALALAMACDIRIASESARLIEAYIRLGISPENGTTYFLPRLVGISKALELAWTGDAIEAREAERIGLVSRVVPHEDIMKATGELAKRLAGGPSVAIQVTKRAMYKGLEARDLAAHMELERLFGKAPHDTEDAAEARKAFQEKRAPVFKGR